MFGMTNLFRFSCLVVQVSQLLTLVNVLLVTAKCGCVWGF